MLGINENLVATNQTGRQDFHRAYQPTGANEQYNLMLSADYALKAKVLTALVLTRAKVEFPPRGLLGREVWRGSVPAERGVRQGVDVQIDAVGSRGQVAEGIFAASVGGSDLHSACAA
ncbi:MAG: hypothetical protein QGM50_04300 [Anaerolineae bacterium]|nr:hypothetical protein [Anaerolineae bacterium]